MKKLSVLCFSLALQSVLAQGPEETLTLEERYERDEFNPSFYDESLYEVEKDSANFLVVEKYRKKDNTYLNYVRKWLYDERGNLLEHHHLDISGHHKYGVVCSAPLVRYAYNNKNQVIRTSYWQNDTTKMVHDCDFYHRVESAYDAKGRVTKHTSYSTEGKVLTKVTFGYNAKDQRSKVVYLNENGTIKEGERSIVLLKYDNQDRVIKTTYKNSNGKLPKDPKTVCIITKAYEDEFHIETRMNVKREVLKKVKITNQGMVTQIEDWEGD